jgi:hypothetical protein
MAATLDDLLFELQAINAVLHRTVAIGKTAKVIPQDGVNLPDGPCKALLLSADGYVSYMVALEGGLHGSFRSAVPLQKGYNPIPVAQVWATGTTGTLEIEAIY